MGSERFEKIYFSVELRVQTVQTILHIVYNNIFFSFTSYNTHGDNEGLRRCITMILKRQKENRQTEKWERKFRLINRIKLLIIIILCLRYYFFLLLSIHVFQIISLRSTRSRGEIQKIYKSEWRRLLYVFIKILYFVRRMIEKTYVNTNTHRTVQGYYAIVLNIFLSTALSGILKNVSTHRMLLWFWFHRILTGHHGVFVFL